MTTTDPAPRRAASGLPERVDAVVVGGGASGLSLAAHLACSRWSDRDVLVLDDGSRALPGRGWAFWSASPGLLAGAVSTSFDRFEIRRAERVHVVTLDRYRYRVVRGGDLSAAVDSLLGATPGVRRRAGHVSAVRDGLRHAEVLVDGRTVRADWVFDSVGVSSGGPVVDDTRRQRGRRRPVPSSAGAVDSLVFSGRHVETEEDTFDPCTPVLMDFRTTQRPGPGFVYVLPSSPRSALVEHTRFSRTRDALGQADSDLDTYLAEVLHVGPHQVVGAERGHIHLSTARPPAPRGRVVPIGTPAGMVRASTGYGYARMQRHSAALVGSLLRHGHPFDVAPAPRRYRWLDRTLLTAAAREPERVVEAFERLFARNPGDRVLSFLDQDTTVAQELVLVRSLPPGPFLRAVLPSSRARP